MKKPKTNKGEHKAAHPIRGGVRLHRSVGPLLGDKRNSLAKASDKWLESAEGLCIARASTLGHTNPDYYLRNRLEAAFIAGANWMERDKQNRLRPNGTEIR